MIPEQVNQLSRRRFLRAIGASVFTTSMATMLPKPAWALPGPESIQSPGPLNRYDLSLEYMPVRINGRRQKVLATGINGMTPGPLVHVREGEHVTLNVTNNLPDVKHSSIHWHGILVPFRMDGVPGINFNGIAPGETYNYNYRLKQAGTYWYHSHSFFQEQTLMHGPMIIEPKEPEPWHYDRDYTVLLADWADEGPDMLFRNITMDESYYNFQKRILTDTLGDIGEMGFWEATADRLAWGEMRMSPRDFLGVTGFGYTYLVNGHDPDENWTGLFNPGETVRLRFINGSAMSIWDVRIPGLDMKVVMVDGKKVKPVDIHEFRISVAETYDVLVTPKEDKAYTIFVEAQDRSGYGRGTLAPEYGMEAPIPPLRDIPERKLEDIAMGAMDNKYNPFKKKPPMSKMKKDKVDPQSVREGKAVKGPAGPHPFLPKENVNVAMRVKHPKYRYMDPGVGLGEDKWKVLSYADLVSDEPQQYSPKVDREMTINITANMGRFMFSFDGKKFSQHPGPYLFRHNERLRLWLVNHTMMGHPIHLHGMWMQIENDQPHDKIPYKHTVLVKPGEKISVLITPIEKGDWAFHCHLLYHLEAGMFQVVRVA